MSVTNGKPFAVTTQQANAKWGGCGDPLHCSLCGHVFVPDEIARFVYANGTAGAGCGNFFTCVSCDGEDVLNRGIVNFRAATESARRWGVYGPDWPQHI